MGFNPLEIPIIFSNPRRVSGFSAWIAHTPFAMGVIALCRPRVFVELGTHAGDSYCAFCQAVSELQLATRCFAVDTWAGDVHTGQYPKERLQSLRAHHDPRYGAFSMLIQSDFDSAVGRFEEGSIDLLHIDGEHTYEGGKKDF